MQSPQNDGSTGLVDSSVPFRTMHLLNKDAIIFNFSYLLNTQESLCTTAAFLPPEHTGELTHNRSFPTSWTLRRAYAQPQLSYLLNTQESLCTTAAFLPPEHTGELMHNCSFPTSWTHRRAYTQPAAFLPPEQRHQCTPYTDYTPSTSLGILLNIYFCRVIISDLTL